MFLLCRILRFEVVFPYHVCFAEKVQEMILRSFVPCRSAAFARMSRFVFSLGFAASLLLFPSCRREKTDFGAGQRAHLKETELRNKTLLEQFVLASEEMEAHPDPSYLENALARLNPWLTGCTASRDFQPSEEYTQKQTAFQELGKTAESIHTICVKAGAGKQGDSAGSEELSQDEANALSENLDHFLSQIETLNADYNSPLLTRFQGMASDLKAKISEAGGFQFGSKGKMVGAAVARFPFTPLLNFGVIARGAASVANLYQLDSRSFFPEDTSHFKSCVWERNAASWAKGESSDPAEQVYALFRWACDIAPLRAASNSPDQEPIPQLAWQTLLTSQANGEERAAVFMGLLRQIGVSSCLIRPGDPAKETEFPLIVGVALPDAETGGSSLRLFLPEYGVPIPGADSPVLVNEGDSQGLRFPSVASLADVAENDALLRKLDLPDAPFPLNSADFTHVKAEIPTDMFNMSERMWIMMRESVIERSGQDDTAYVPPMLAVSFDAVQTELRAFPQIVSVEHGWRFHKAVIEQTILPVESQILLLPYLYEVPASAELSVRSDTENSRNYAPTEGAGSGTDNTVSRDAKMVYPLWEGKILFFKGAFDKENGAASRLIQGRVPDRILKQASAELGDRVQEYLRQVQEAQSAGGGEPLSEEQLRAVAVQFVSQGRQDLGMKLCLKVTARFYLGLVSYALRNSDAAVSHLEDADLLTKLDGMWKSGTLTLLAEIYESRGDFARAEKIYERLDGPAASGGKLRAKWLREAAAP